MITVNARLFKAASLFVSGEDTRNYIQGVCIEPHPEGALLVATDGRRVVAILDRKGSAERPGHRQAAASHGRSAGRGCHDRRRR